MIKFGRLTAPLLVALASAEQSEHVNYAFLTAARAKKAQQRQATDATSMAARVANEVGSAESAVEAELRKDHAPLALQQQEKRLLDGAFKAATEAAHLKMRGGRASAKIAAKHEATAGLGAMAARVAHEVKDAEHAVEAELRKDNAPAALQMEEKKLLDGAFKAARDVAHLTMHHKSSEKRAEAGSQQMLRSIASGLSKSVAEERSRLKDTEYVEGEAMKALKEEHIDSSVQSRVASLLHQAEHMEKQELKMSAKDLRGVAAIERAEERQHKQRGRASMEATLNREMQVLAKADTDRMHKTEQVEATAKAALEEANVDPETEKKVQSLLSQAENAERREAALESGRASRTEVKTQAEADSRFNSAMKQLVKQERKTLRETAYVEHKAEQALEAVHADAATEEQVKELLDKAQQFEKKDIQLSSHRYNSKTLVAQHKAIHAGRFDTALEERRLEHLQKENSQLRGENKRLQEEHSELIREVHLEAENTALVAQNKVLSAQNSQLEGKLSEQ
eukprot:TRINITY_DN113511_c0_g1_i1.p1 TRINITY_DN113511_c0_g1~~TRINITY_DN113511_c0_g1_i1.p1  ORF type:complete len:510 (+),score=218.71 TRINITY_DN113511_c0_g1_i1:68-1597(+)